MNGKGGFYYRQETTSSTKFCALRDPSSKGEGQGVEVYTEFHERNKQGSDFLVDTIGNCYTFVTNLERNRVYL